MSKKFNPVPKTGQLHSPEEMNPETPLETSERVGELSGGEYQQFASETEASKRKRGKSND